MAKALRADRRWIALMVWASGLILFGAFGWWNLQSFKEAGEDRMIGEAGRIASQIAGLLAMPGLDADFVSAKSIITGTLEDDRIYAVRVDTNTGIQEGQRRNYLWEPVPWDDEITDNCVQGMTPIRVNGEIVGKVEVWLSTRLEDEEEAELTGRELWRFGLTALVWTIIILIIFRPLSNFGMRREKSSGQGESRGDPERVLFDMRAEGATGRDAEDEDSIVNAPRGRAYQRAHPDAWLVTAGMFRQTFARGPALLSRLYADGETAGLCHLGRMLEQAAPCVGAGKLFIAAREMQAALNDPDRQSQGREVEKCVVALEEVLDALRGNGQWRSKPGMTR